MGLNGKPEIRYTEHLPDYLIHLNNLATRGQADGYKDGNRIVYIKLQEYDHKLFPVLEKVDHVYLVYRRGKK